MLSSYVRTASLASLFREACLRPSDINEHLWILNALAASCDHVTEMGSRSGVSTTAFLAARPKKLVCYDLYQSPEIAHLMALAPPTDMVFMQESTLEAVISPTELLLIDTLHTWDQLSVELDRHAPSVSRYLAMHDTEIFGSAGEIPGHVGLWPAVKDYLSEHPEWRIAEVFKNNNGLTVLERV